MIKTHSREFETIEGAHACMTLLGEALEEARTEIERHISDQTTPRTLEALYLVNHKLDQLQHHVVASAKILTDLRRLRRILFDEGKDTPA